MLTHSASYHSVPLNLHIYVLYSPNNIYCVSITHLSPPLEEEEHPASFLSLSSLPTVPSRKRYKESSTSAEGTDRPESRTGLKGMWIKLFRSLTPALSHWVQMVSVCDLMQSGE